MINKCPECDSEDLEVVDLINGHEQFECQQCEFQFWSDDLEPDE